MAMIDTFVSLDGPTPIYPARLDPAKGWNWVSPTFTLDTVRRIAIDTQAWAAKCGHDYADTLHVIDGGTQAVVLRVDWRYPADGGGVATTVIEPGDDGRYSIANGEWSWYHVEDGRLAAAHRAAEEARTLVLTESVRKVGEILRQAADATGAGVQVDVTGHLRIVSVDLGDHAVWRMEDEDGPFDSETLGVGDEVLRSALTFGAIHDALGAAGWKNADKSQPDLYSIEFPPLAVQ